MEITKLKLTEKRKQILASLNLQSIKDILEYYPYRYEYNKRTPFNEFVNNATVLFECVIASKPITSYFGRRNVTRFKVLYEDNELSVSIFNRNWINRVAVGSRIVIKGKYEGNNKVIAMNYYQKNIEEIEGIIPVYSLKEGITQNEVKKIIDIALDNADTEYDEFIPDEYLSKHKLIDLKSAIKYIHKPDNVDNLKKALARIKYNEFLLFFSCINLYNYNNAELRNINKKFDDSKIDELIKSLPYELTDDQLVSKDEILNDIKSNHLMRRLLQGEVGSGKTVVAMLALYANYLSGYQGAIMAPTEILAYQHYLFLDKVLKPFNVNVRLLTSSADNKTDIKNELLDGSCNIVVGTHALFQKDVEFNNLGLAVVDEQQRFGVNQRLELKNKGDNVDILLMTATPIPRTLANTLYGDLDISTIKSLPKTRKQPDTIFINENSIKDIADELNDRLNEGSQLYIIASAIEQSDNVNIKDLNRLLASIKGLFKNLTVESLHGKMSNEEKKLIMDKFADGEINILVSTTVVEVGIDVGNADTMVIYNAERFGLSQLHQLRGRIQRGKRKGILYLLSDTQDEEAKERLDALCKTNDGFEISMMDLKQRGPGDIIGTKQSGLPTFHLGNIVEDTKILNGAKEDAKEIFDSNEYSEFKNYIQNNYQNADIV